MTENWIARFSGLAQLGHEERATLQAKSSVISAPKGALIFGPGKSPEHYLLLLKGAVRVHQISESGREIVLYRVNAGESCVMTTACMLAHENYSAEGIADTDIQAVAIPRLAFDDLLAQSSEFRNFVFSAYSRRITDLFHVIEEIAFQRLDIRLAQKLIEMAQRQGLVKATHQQLAVELGTAREVISRQLQEFQRRNWIAQTRGAVEILQPDALADLAGNDGT